MHCKDLINYFAVRSSTGIVMKHNISIETNKKLQALEKMLPDKKFSVMPSNSTQICQIDSKEKPSPVCLDLFFFKL